MQRKPIPPVSFNESNIRDRDIFGAPRSRGRTHAGVDLYKPEGTSVHAAFGGRVIRSTSEKEHKGYGKGFGDLVIIDHTPEIELGQQPFLRFNLYTLYAHLKDRSVNLDQKVEQGYIIGTVGNTGNARRMKPHLHFEVIRSPEKLGWNRTGNTGVDGSLYRIDPLQFLRGITLSMSGYGEPEPLTDEEMDRFYKEIKTDLRLGSKPALLVDLPGYKEFIKKTRGEYPPHGVRPPRVKLKFENNFSREFLMLFPSVELEVNGRSLGRIQTGTGTYELDILR